MDGFDLVYLVLCSTVVMLTLATLSSFGHAWEGVAVILAIGAEALIFAMAQIDYVVFPLVTTILGITTQPAKDYLIPKSNDAILKNVNGLFYATGFVTANLFGYTFKLEEQEENVEEKMASSPENWERAVMSLNFPFRLNVISVGRDVQRVRDELEGQRGYQEFQLARTLQDNKAASETIIIDIKRKISMLQTKMSRIYGGEKPISVLMYFETTAVGVSEKAALDALTSQIKQIQVGMSVLDVQLARIAGRELYSLFKYNFSIPITREDITNEFSTQG
ncbi:MAG TPA: hypothetical protein VL944_00960 [Candidatus Acidoferrum sp.]|nr:hypothetical protein [Candidatus Acidoferrum sp.]